MIFGFSRRNFWVIFIFFFFLFFHNLSPFIIGIFYAHLEVYDYSKDQYRCQEIHEIRKILTIESLAKSPNFVLSRGQEMEQSNHSSFEFCATSGVYRCRWECFPYDCFTDIRSNEKRYSTAETVTLLQKFIKQQNNKTSYEKLDNDEQTNASANFGRVSVHSSHYVNDCLTNRDYHAEYWKYKIDPMNFKILLFRHAISRVFSQLLNKVVL